MKALFIAAAVIAGAVMVSLAPARAGRAIVTQPVVVQPAPVAGDEATPAEALGPGLAESAYAAPPIVAR